MAASDYIFLLLVLVGVKNSERVLLLHVHFILVVYVPRLISFLQLIWHIFLQRVVARRCVAAATSELSARVWLDLQLVLADLHALRVESLSWDRLMNSQLVREQLVFGLRYLDLKLLALLFLLLALCSLLLLDPLIQELLAELLAAEGANLVLLHPELQALGVKDVLADREPDHVQWLEFHQADAALRVLVLRYFFFLALAYGAKLLLRHVLIQGLQREEVGPLLHLQRGLQLLHLKQSLRPDFEDYDHNPDDEYGQRCAQQQVDYAHACVRQLVDHPGALVQLPLDHDVLVIGLVLVFEQKQPLDVLAPLVHQLRVLDPAHVLQIYLALQKIVVLAIERGH